MGRVKDAERVLCEEAVNFAEDPKREEGKTSFLRAAWEYGKAKTRAANSRDRWKRKKRLKQ